MIDFGIINDMKNRLNQTVCEWVGVEPVTPESGTKVGIALSTLGAEPINGVRHKPENGTNGWYFWCGEEVSSEEHFFSPLHVERIAEYLPQVQEYLCLPPGYRFLIDDNNYEDVWFDQVLQNV